MKNANWFNAMVEFRNTVRNIQSIWSVPRAIAQEIQHSAATRQSQVECDNIAKFSRELCSQIGF